MTISELMQAMTDAGAPMGAILIAVRAIEERDRAEKDRKARDAAKTRLYRSRGGGAIPDDLRLSVYERDQYCCVYCGSGDNLQCDHVVPVSKGGATTLENLATACRTCNVRKKIGTERHLSEQCPRKFRGTKFGFPRKSAHKRPPRFPPKRYKSNPLPTPPNPRFARIARGKFCAASCPTGRRTT